MSSTLSSALGCPRCNGYTGIESALHRRGSKPANAIQNSLNTPKTPQTLSKKPWTLPKQSKPSQTTLKQCVPAAAGPDAHPAAGAASAAGVGARGRRAAHPGDGGGSSRGAPGHPAGSGAIEDGNERTQSKVDMMYLDNIMSHSGPYISRQSHKG